MLVYMWENSQQLWWRSSGITQCFYLTFLLLKSFLPLYSIETYACKWPAQEMGSARLWLVVNNTFALVWVEWHHQKCLPFSEDIVYTQAQTGICTVCLHLLVHLGAWCKMILEAWVELREEDRQDKTSRCSFMMRNEWSVFGENSVMMWLLFAHSNVIVSSYRPWRGHFGLHYLSPSKFRHIA